MSTFPKTLLAFQEQFPDDDACWQTLHRMRWPHGFRCPRCGHRKSCSLARRGLEQCQRCRYQASVTAGTIFHKTRVPLRAWLLAIFFVARHKVDMGFPKVSLKYGSIASTTLGSTGIVARLSKYIFFFASSISVSTILLLSSYIRQTIRRRFILASFFFNIIYD